MPSGYDLDTISNSDIDNADEYIPDPQDYAITLTGLFRAGDITVTDSGHLVCIDLSVRRSGVVLYGTGSTLDEALDDVQAQLFDHTSALDHLADLGVDPLNVGRMVSDEYDNINDRDLATFGYDDERLDLYDYGFDNEYDPNEYDPTLFIPPPPVPTPVFAAAGEPIDIASPGYILALLIPVKEGLA